MIVIGVPQGNSSGVAIPKFRFTRVRFTVATEKRGQTGGKTYGAF